MQKLLVECPNNEDDDDGNGSESSATNPICEEKICYTRTDQPLLIPEFNPLTLNVGIQCCITAKTFVNAKTQTDDCYLRQLDNTINTESCYPQSPSTNHHLLDHNYYADRQHFFDEPVIVSKPPLQTTLPEHELEEPDQLSPAAYVKELDAMSNGSDTEYHPENEVQSGDECESVPIVTKRPKNFIVSEEALNKLFKVCITCGQAILDQSKFIKGSMVSVKSTCINGHINRWDSQPYVNGMPLCNLLIPAAILFTGNTFKPIEHFSSCLNLQMISKTTFYKVQNKYVFPVIHNTWHNHQKQVLQSIKERKVQINVAGDGRCDSPGHSAKYGTYSLLDESSGKVIDFSLVQVTEVSSSNAMEYEGCKRSLKKLIAQKIPVRCLTTDKHVTITARMRTEFPKIIHQYDVWHLSKSVTKKLTKKAKKKCNEELLSWIQSVSNHLWWSVATCDGNTSVMKEKWLSIINHIANKHKWRGGKHFKKCAHRTLTRNEKKQVPCLKAGSPALVALEDVISNTRLLKDMEKLTEFHHTGALEVHSLMLKYLPKRKHFTYSGMLARTQLAALDHNHNCSRAQAVVKSGTCKGQQRFKVEKPKANKSWVCKPIKEPKFYKHLSGMLDDVVKAKQSGVTRVEALPQMPKNIVKEPKPSKQTIIEKHKSRMSK